MIRYDIRRYLGTFVPTGIIPSKVPSVPSYPRYLISKRYHEMR